MRWLVALERGLLGGLMGAIAIITFLQVALRYLFGVPLAWSEEVGRFCLVWLTFIGAGVLVRRADGHPAVDTLPLALSGGPRGLVEAASRLLVIVGCVAMGWGGARMAQVQWAQTSPSLELSMGMVYLCIPVGAALGVVWGIRALARGPEITGA
jgi:TRAP-type C4-dicarboxylate transport system permease small subunit